jgi:hypothetical protein
MRSFVTTLLTFVLVGCATAPTFRQIERQAEFPGAEFGAVWDAVIDVFGDRSWTIDNMERASGFITTEWMGAATGGYLDCGSPGLAVDRNPRGRFNVVVRESPSGVAMTVNTSWQVSREIMGEVAVVDCASTGVLERELHETVKGRVAEG